MLSFYVRTEVPPDVSPGVRKPYFCLQQLPVGVGSDVSLEDHNIGSATIVDGIPNMYY